MQTLNLITEPVTPVSPLPPAGLPQLPLQKMKFSEDDRKNSNISKSSMKKKLVTDYDASPSISPKQKAPKLKTKDKQSEMSGTSPPAF